MKSRQMIVFVTVLVLLCSIAEAINFSFLDDFTEAELQELRMEIDDRLTEMKKNPSGGDDGEPVAATRSDPVLVGQTLLCKIEDYSGDSLISMEMVCTIRGAGAKALVKSFSRTNLSFLDKGSEWFLVMVRIEVLEADNEKVNLYDNAFHFVSKDGAEYGYSDGHIWDNPAEIKPLYVGSTLDAWIGCKVKTGDDPLITYENRDGDNLWFNPNVRVLKDTSAMAFKPLASKDSGRGVTELQYRLMEYGLLTVVPSGTYDKDTASAVKNFQKAFGAEGTGTADEETLRLLYTGKPLPR